MASVLYSLFNKSKKSSVKMDETFTKQNDDIPGQLNKLEYFLINVLKILLWDDPFMSCWCIVFVNILFGFIIYFECKFYGIIFLTLLGLMLDRLWKEFIVPFFTKKYSNSNSQYPVYLRTFTLSQLINYLKQGQTLVKNTYFNAKLLRQTEPGVFCIKACAYFLLLNLIGQNISDVASSYIFVMLCMTVPGLCFRFLPPNIISTLSNILYSSHKEEDEEVEPYLPESNPEALELLRLAGDLQISNKEDDEESNDLLLEKISARTNETTDSEYSKLSFYPDSPIMPSPENSMDFLDLDLQGGHSERGTESSDINFQSKHFDGESSDEEEFVKGLNLKEESSKKINTKNNQSSSNVSSILNAENLISMGANLLTAVVNQQKARDERESSSDTDSFEMISEEDM